MLKTYGKGVFKSTTMLEIWGKSRNTQPYWRKSLAKNKTMAPRRFRFSRARGQEEQGDHDKRSRQLPGDKATPPHTTTSGGASIWELPLKSEQVTDHSAWRIGNQWSLECAIYIYIYICIHTYIYKYIPTYIYIYIYIHMLGRSGISGLVHCSKWRARQTGIGAAQRDPTPRSRI